jgi:hypothetical protein
MPDCKYIIRYISLGKFIEMLNSCTLHLSRIDLFEDKTEGEWYAHLAKSANKAFKDWESKSQLSGELNVDDDNNSLVDTIMALKKRSYISSWFSSDYLSIAMWKLYGITDEGIAIRVKKETIESLEELNRDYLQETGADILFSNVMYVEDDASEMEKLIDKNMSNKEWVKFRNLLLKHKSYKFEEEYRVSVMLPEGKTEYPRGIKLTIGNDLNEFIDSIYLNPLIHADHWYIEVVQKVLSTFNIEPKKLNLAEIRTDLG